jgi:hypothetical protein
MKKIVLTATFTLASLGALAANGQVKSNHAFIPVKNKPAKLDLKLPSACDAHIETGIFTIVVLWYC